ncbi:hypothetical protein niasHS_007834 [Heterodera schachtii]|uniref:Uncharacterized protein n=1 Tax=Heterodera schachtii TaxID=97005 RepID=A0ABD2JPR7_HETSC
MRSFFLVSLALVLLFCASTTYGTKKGCMKICVGPICWEICPKTPNNALTQWLNISLPIPEFASMPKLNLTDTNYTMVVE